MIIAEKRNRGPAPKGPTTPCQFCKHQFSNAGVRQHEKTCPGPRPAIFQKLSTDVPAATPYGPAIEPDTLFRDELVAALTDGGAKW